MLEHRVEHHAQRARNFNWHQSRYPNIFGCRGVISGSMDMEGGSVSRPPLLDGTNYDYWKARMMAFLRSMDS